FAFNSSANGSTSGITLTPVVNLNGAMGSPLGKVSSTIYAVQPRFGGVTLATYTPSPCSCSGELFHFGPMLVTRKSRAPGLVACHSFTSDGLAFVCTRIVPSFSIFQSYCGNSAPVRTAL